MVASYEAVYTISACKRKASDVTYNLAECGRVLSQSSVTSRSLSVPCPLRSPESRRTSPGGTGKMNECVSEMQTKRVQPGPGWRGGCVISYQSWTTAVCASLVSRGRVIGSDCREFDELEDSVKDPERRVYYLYCGQSGYEELRVSGVRCSSQSSLWARRSGVRGVRRMYISRPALAGTRGTASVI